MIVAGWIEKRRCDDHVRGCSIASSSDIPQRCNSQHCPNVGVMRLRLKRIPEEDQEINVTLSDHRADLLVSAEWTTHESFDLKP